MFGSYKNVSTLNFGLIFFHFILFSDLLVSLNNLLNYFSLSVLFRAIDIWSIRDVQFWKSSSRVLEWTRLPS
ncbi:hypothetical protein M6B38_275795 [Iris pallida]|uniref:Uncharacterized protein n=1 Tax=Iris pallida TaxID=29817 RepID=A0AAX6I656_IRIPA|nr:hypothetical protein M6B38_275795 [Iris pallida]